nr:hypothetical protein [uncultured Anaerobutyricum sp.]
MPSKVKGGSPFYQPFWFAVLLTNMYAYQPTNTGKGSKVACLAGIRTFKNSLYFRKLFCLIFFTVMILFRTLLNRNMWMNPLSDVMGGWDISVFGFVLQYAWRSDGRSVVLDGVEGKE